MAKKQTNKKQQQMEVLYGAHAIIEMLKGKTRKLYSIYTLQNPSKGFNRTKKYLPKSVPNIQYVGRDVLDRMAGSTDHNGVVALVSPFKYQPTIFNPTTSPRILLLDAVQDVGNFGAILRSAYCTGIDGVVICQKQGAPMTPAVFKASAGLAEHLPIYQTSTLKQAITVLKNAGYNFYMAVLDGEDATTVEYTTPSCLVIGNEAIGISKDILSYGTSVTLPQKTSEISYNASVAAGILMFLMSMKK